MRARRGKHGGGTRGGKSVYTRPGPNAYPDELVIDEVPAPADAKPSEPARVCPHGGAYIGEIAICGECAHANQTTEDVFGRVFWDIARKASWSVRVKTETPDDCVIVALIALVANQKKILKADSPGRYAMVVAQRAIRKLYRKQIPLAVSQMDSRETDWLDNRAALADPLGESMILGGVGIESEEWRFPIPGVNLLWNAKNIERLRIYLDEAIALLDKHVWRVITMHIGYYDGQPQHTWQEIAAELSTSWKPLTPRQIQYACQQGLTQMKVYLLQKLILPSIQKSTI